MFFHLNKCFSCLALQSGSSILWVEYRHSIRLEILSGGSALCRRSRSSHALAARENLENREPEYIGGIYGDFD